MNLRLETHLEDVIGIVKHLEEILNYSSVNRQRAQRNLDMKHQILPDAEEIGFIPIIQLPRKKNNYFYGRTEELAAIDKALNWRHKENHPLRTYTIYGKRGVGKTELALEYAHSNPAGFDYIFWIQCETGLALRQSFTDMAIALDLPKAAEHGHHEENQLAVLTWLKKTPRRWLLIFDNAERASIMKGYWPFGANGAILITSRSYYNFLNDDQRRGDTVKPFNKQQSFQLLTQLLGPDWTELREQRLLKRSEVDAAFEWLQQLEGLALAVAQASTLIKDDTIGGQTIQSTYEYFKERSLSLPDRVSGPRSDLYHALDTLWDMSFNLLTTNARKLLSVMSLLTPDVTYMEIFLPRRQKALLEPLAFCRQQAAHLDSNTQATLTSVVAPTRALQDAIDELRRRNLIKTEGRILSVHREVQEAMNYHSAEELQDYFDAAISIVYEAFPKRKHGISLFSQWPVCSQYIHDGVHIALKFSEYTRPPIVPRLRTTDKLVALIGNCAWYLYEVGDYDNALLIIDIAYTAIGDTSSLLYADLNNTEGNCKLELNKLLEGRQCFNIALSIREARLAADDIELAAVYHNMGNLESAAGNYDAAMDYFRKTEAIRMTQGETAENQLALLYLCIGRCMALETALEGAQDYAEAQNMVSRAENLFARTIGAEKHFMAQ